MTELNQRVISGIVLAVVFLGAIFLGGWVFIAVNTVAALFIWSEWYEMNLSAADDRVKFVGFAGVTILGLMIAFLGNETFFIAVLGLLAAAIATMVYLSKQKMAIIGLFYAGGFLLSMSLLRGEGHFLPGLIALIFLCVVVWSTDIGAYFVGRKFGGPKLARAISPNKTISGAVGGLFFAAIGALLVARIAGLQNDVILLGLAVVLSAISQCGDLFESHLKRAAGMKDSGQLIPGHGGIMDRVDGLLFAAIFLWLVSSIFGGLTHPALTFFS